MPLMSFINDGMRSETLFPLDLAPYAEELQYKTSISCMGKMQEYGLMDLQLRGQHQEKTKVSRSNGWDIATAFVQQDPQQCHATK